MSCSLGKVAMMAVSMFENRLRLARYSHFKKEHPLEKPHKANHTLAGG
jgi:hypothetical protein